MLLSALTGTIKLGAFEPADSNLPATQVFVSVQQKYTIRFIVDRYSLERGFADNASNLDSLVNWLNAASDGAVRISKITIRAAASPEGPHKYNVDLARRRAESVRDYILAKTGIDASLISLNPVGPDYEGLRKLADTTAFQHRDEVIDILDNTPLYIYRDGKIVDGKKKQLMDLRGGRPWNWMLSNLYPILRRTEVAIDYYRSVSEQTDSPDAAKSINPEGAKLVTEPEKPVAEPAMPVTEPETPAIVPALPAETEQQPAEPEKPADAEQPAETAPDTLEPEPAESEPAKEFKGIIAFGTNALYDAALTPNFSVEVPIGRHWSAGLNYTFPWYIWKGNSRAYEILHLDLFARYYFKPSRALTGWFAGINAGAGYYDIQPDGDGYQGEALIFSLEGGYSWQLSRHWSFNLSAAAGRMVTNYRKYNGVHSVYMHLVKQYEGTFTWFGPTRLNAGFTYLFGRNASKKK